MSSDPLTSDLFEDTSIISDLQTPNFNNSKNPDFEAVEAQLKAIDWNFPTRTRHSDLEGLHPYPAKFIAEIPRSLLQSIPVPEGTSVLDPFCGCGTTLSECQRFELPSVGVDLNPIACLISRVKTNPLPDGVNAVILSILEMAEQDESPTIPSIPKLNHWFKGDIQRALASLTTAIDRSDPKHRDILQLILSSIIVRVSNQESDTRYAAIEKPIVHKDVFDIFKKSANRIIAAISSRDFPPTNARIIQADTLKVSANTIGNKIGLVITSPPYPNAYEYWLYHKYRMWWLGEDPIHVKEREIGARAHFFKRNPHTADDFSRQMAATFDLLQTVMVTGGYACFIIGRSKIHGKIVDNAKTIEEVGIKAGFNRIFSTERILSPHRKSFNLSHANIKKETVLVLRFGDGPCT